MVILLLLPTLTFAVAVHDGVTSTASPSLNVRATPSTSGNIIYSVPPGTVGLVQSGPVVADGFTWWYISWASNPLTPGWSVQDYLSVIPPSTTPYSDILGGGWYDQPWSNTSVNYSSTVVRAGNDGIFVNASAAFARLYIKTNGFDTTNQQSLHLSLLNPNGNGQLLYVGLYNTSGTVIHYVPAWQYVAGNYLYAGSWYDLVIPIADLQATNQTIGGVVIEIEAAGTFYADEISFSTTYGSTYWTPPTVTSVSVSCSPTTVVTGNTSQCTKTVTGTGNPDNSVTWKVNGIQNGNSTVGTINPGVDVSTYIAPGTVPNPATVTITATSVLDPTKSGSTNITISGSTSIQASDVIFDDAFQAGWFLGSWSQVTVNPTSDFAYQGNYGMQIQVATPSWGRAQLKTQQNYQFNTTGYNYLSFAVNIGQYEGEALYVGLLNSSGTVIRYVTLSSYTTTGTLDAYQWQLVKIPLSDLNAVNINVYGVEVQSAQPATFSIDEVKFLGSCQ